MITITPHLRRPTLRIRNGRQHLVQGTIVNHAMATNKDRRRLQALHADTKAWWEEKEHQSNRF